MARSSQPKRAKNNESGHRRGHAQRPGGQQHGSPGQRTTKGSSEDRGGKRSGHAQSQTVGQKPAKKPDTHSGNKPNRKPHHPKVKRQGQREQLPRPAALDIPEGAHLIPGRQPVTEWLRAKHSISAIFCERNIDLSPIPELAQAAGITLAYAGRDQMDEVTGGVMHQGVLAVARPLPEPALSDHLGHDLVVIADGITDARNLGAIARSAEQAGAGCLIVRARRAASTSPAAEKASAGAFAWLPVITVSNISHAVNTLKDAGMWAVALDSGDDAQNLHTLGLMDERVALIVGEEGSGISRVVREKADAVAEIPMVGHLDSLNASVAAGIALFEWVRRHNM
ncbi:23S rRNA (guanosine(2251)-2'-O)-methyltransferase RlmB [Stomatohabitans albus]|uniref:23S rRNA (guanosine(2251)-2'-O)-methyltransferase RlmB n=1 Tax=Stomatohabitans albus TaxID=3110766 RepID=UPI00300C09AB